MVSKTKLLLVACSKGDTEQLARDMYDILQRDYGLEEQVALLVALRKEDVDRGNA